MTTFLDGGVSPAQGQASGPVPVKPSYLYYLYCVVEAGMPAHRLLQERRVPGLEPGEPLFPVEAAGLVAAVSRVPGDTFQEESLNALMQELPRLAPFAWRHDAAIRALLPTTPALVPIALGALYRTPQGVVDLLQRDTDRLHGLLSRLRGRQEWGIKVFRDPRKVLEAAETHSGQVQRLAEEAAASTPGRAYLLRKQRERLLAGEAERLLDTWLDAILHRLAQVSAEVRVEDLPSVQAESLPLALKAAFLVPAEAVEAFRATAAELEAAYTPMGLRLETTGPWAPYSFVGA